MGGKRQKRQTGPTRQEKEALHMVKRLQTDIQKLKKNKSQQLRAEREKQKRAMQNLKRQLLNKIDKERENHMQYMAEMQAFLIAKIHHTRVAVQQVGNGLQDHSDLITHLQGAWSERHLETRNALRKEHRTLKRLDSDVKHLRNIQEE